MTALRAGWRVGTGVDGVRHTLVRSSCGFWTAASACCLSFRPAAPEPSSAAPASPESTCSSHTWRERVWRSRASSRSSALSEVSSGAFCFIFSCASCCPRAPSSPQPSVRQHDDLVRRPTDFRTSHKTCSHKAPLRLRSICSALSSVSAHQLHGG